jgi:hypothetical protein
VDLTTRLQLVKPTHGINQVEGETATGQPAEAWNLDTVDAAIAALQDRLPSPGGTDTQIQFNDGGVLAGHSALTFDKASSTFTSSSSGSGAFFFIVRGAGLINTLTVGPHSISLSALEASATLSMQAAGTVTLQSATTSRIAGSGAAVMIEVNGANKIGFFGATAIVKPGVSGSRGGNAALASLLTQLVALGLISDSTSA